MRSLYSGVSGLRNHQTRMDVIGNNIANVNTVGFKKDRVNFQDVFYQMLVAPAQPPEAGTQSGVNGQFVGIGVGVGSIDTLHTQGAVMYTGAPTDVMISGDGYFILSDTEGNTYYTRSGVFGIDTEGRLINKANGLYVAGINGNQIDLGDIESIASFSIDRNGAISVTDLEGNTEVVDTIKLAKFANPEGLQKVGETMFRETVTSGPPLLLAEGGVPGYDGLGTLVPGSLEMSNVDLAQEFTDMITTQRGFQANARIITVSDEMLQEVVNLKR